MPIPLQATCCGGSHDGDGADSNLMYFAFSLEALIESMTPTVPSKGKLDASLEELTKKQHSWEAAGTLDTTRGASLLLGIGLMKYLRGDPTAALSAYEHSLQIRKRTGTLETPEGAQLLRSIGIATCCAGNMSGARQVFAEALRIFEETGSQRSLDSAMHWTCTGFARWADYDLPGCIEAYKKARHIRTQIGALDTVDGARLLTNIGAAQLESGDPEGALLTFLEARHIRTSIGELDSTEGAHAIVNVGAAEFACGRFSKAVGTYGSARQALERLSSTTSAGEPAGLASLMVNIGMAEYMVGNLQSACQAYEEALWHLDVNGGKVALASTQILVSLARMHMEQGCIPSALGAVCRALKCRAMAAVQSCWTPDFFGAQKTCDVVRSMEVLILKQQQGHSTNLSNGEANQTCSPSILRLVSQYSRHKDANHEFVCDQVLAEVRSVCTRDTSRRPQELEAGKCTTDEAGPGIEGESAQN